MIVLEVGLLPETFFLSSFFVVFERDILCVKIGALFISFHLLQYIRKTHTHTH